MRQGLVIELKPVDKGLVRNKGECGAVNDEIIGTEQHEVGQRHDAVVENNILEAHVLNLLRQCGYSFLIFRHDGTKHNRRSLHKLGKIDEKSGYMKQYIVEIWGCQWKKALAPTRVDYFWILKKYREKISRYYGIGGAFGIAEDIKKGKPVKYYLYQLPVEVYANLNDSGTETLIGKVVIDVTAAFQGWQYFADVRIWTDTQLDSNLQAFITNAEAAREAACVTIDNVWFDEHNGKETIVIAYTWTNTTNSETCAIYNVAIHAYQNNIELENAYFANANNELLQRNVKPGISVELEEVFYLDIMKRQ